MKTIFQMALLSVSLIGVTLRGQDAAQLARQQTLEADVRRLSAANEVLQENQNAMQKRIDALADRIATLEDRAAHPSSDAVSRDELRKIFDKLKQEIEQKRQEDKTLVLNSIDELRRLIKAGAAAAPARAHSERRERTDSGAGSQNQPPAGDFYEYQVKPDEYLGAIIHAYNKKFKSEGKRTVTLEEVLKVNPGLKPERLRVGQKIYIPKPGPQ